MGVDRMLAARARDGRPDHGRAAGTCRGCTCWRATSASGSASSSFYLEAPALQPGRAAAERSVRRPGARRVLVRGHLRPLPAARRIRNRSHAITEKIDHGDLSEKPGWVRMSIHPTTTDDEVEYVLEAVDAVARHGREWSDRLRVLAADERVHASRRAGGGRGGRPRWFGVEAPADEVPDDFAGTARSHGRVAIASSTGRTQGPRPSSRPLCFRGPPGTAG